MKTSANLSVSLAEYSLSEDSMSAERSLRFLFCTRQHSQFPGLVSWGWSRRNMSVWIRGFRWVSSFSVINIGTLEHHNVRQTVSSWRWVHCWGIGLRFLSPVNGGIVMQVVLLPSLSPLTHISRLRFNSFDIRAKLARAAVCWEHCDGSSSTWPKCMCAGTKCLK